MAFEELIQERREICHVSKSEGSTEMIARFDGRCNCRSFCYMLSNVVY